ncbi:hypothetical protein [Dyadobacter sp. CY312]|uniref:hypothetical protein n=1 Tax=Dyadobacter sp. CY312 TaxID=2907303 RepID=UPI001F3E18D7|nr:hypothetical protein [Dyadobacter sp. CY312]MCE7039274.1 hypothetical protein [Dyadobacter sp. CY312]
MRKLVISPNNLPQKLPLNTFLLALILLHLIGAAGWLIGAVAMVMAVYCVSELLRKDEEIELDVFKHDNKAINKHHVPENKEVNHE